MAKAKPLRSSCFPPGLASQSTEPVPRGQKYQQRQLVSSGYETSSRGLLAGDPGIRITSLQCFLPPSRQAVTLLGRLLSRCAALCSEAQSLSASLSSVDSASQKAPGASLLPQRKAGLPSLSALPVPQVLEVYPPSPMALPLLKFLRPAPTTSPFCMQGTGWGSAKMSHLPREAFPLEHMTRPLPIVNITVP